MGGGVFERRINFEKGYRLYYAKDGNEIVLLLCGGSKSRQQSDIDDARKYLQDYKLRKKKLMTDQARKSKVKEHPRKKK